MASDRIEFGSVLGDKGSDAKLWLLIIPAILGVFAIAGYGMWKMSQAGSLERDAKAAQAQIAELEDARAARQAPRRRAPEEAIQRSAGAAVSLFYGVNPRAQEEWGGAHPAEGAVRACFCGLTPPPEGKEYVVAARTGSGR